MDCHSKLLYRFVSVQKNILVQAKWGPLFLIFISLIYLFLSRYAVLYLNLNQRQINSGLLHGLPTDAIEDSIKPNHLPNNDDLALYRKSSSKTHFYFISSSPFHLFNVKN